MRARVVDQPDSAGVAVRLSFGDAGELVVGIVPARMVERVTGVIRQPQYIVTLTAAMVYALRGDETPPPSGPVLMLVVNADNGRGVAVGPFPDAVHARQWWTPPFNRMARDGDTVAAMVPVVLDPQAGRATPEPG